MKKLTLILFFIGGIVFGQDTDQNSFASLTENNETLILKLGTNIVDSSGKSSPFTSFDEFDTAAFSNPFIIELEYRFSKSFSLALAASVNKWKKNEGVIDSELLSKDQLYSAIDLDLKYYFDESLNFLHRYDWLELYLHGGVGYFKINEGGISLNFGPGANIWFTENVGLNLNGSGKWALNNGDNQYDSNHFQLSAGIAFRFNDVDFDNDGIKDFNDKCPKVHGLRKLYGCPEEIIKEIVAPKDSDGDGVTDNVDKCSKKKGLAKNKGCPPSDNDKDGIKNKDDKCPNRKGPASNNGCPLPDSDNDGVFDKDDKCPKVKGLVKHNGCPFKEVKVGETNSALNKLTPKILFDTSSDNINKASYTVLQQMAQIMKQQPKAVFKLEGHTDSIGSKEFNNRLSESRANSVRNYFIKDLSVPENSIQIEYFGESKPKASNSTKEGRAKNRRVEIIRIK